ncbi:MAG: crossover junction endodeoxyribonuclease RuvC [Parcubacteria group bacterium LiPW_15]|nr:MAG: crossover junction endodeoxyribonuclease RuvC [Parcubacteria group bacterium LiPW_15]
MIFLGIDPGTRRMGYGLVAKNGRETTLVDAGIIKIDSKDDLGALLEIKKGVSELVAAHKPALVAIEKLFFAKNQKTALQVAEARGVALASCLDSGAKILELSPNEVKMGLTGFGSADKKAVLKMVRLILKEPALEVIDDASDALALAILAADRYSSKL